MAIEEQQAFNIQGHEAFQNQSEPLTNTPLSNLIQDKPRNLAKFRDLSGVARDYGFPSFSSKEAVRVAKAEGCKAAADSKEGGGGDRSIPTGAWQLGVWNFKRELKSLRQSLRFGSRHFTAGGKVTSGKKLGLANSPLIKLLREADKGLEGLNLLPELASPELEDQSAPGAALRKELTKLDLDDKPIWRREEARVKKGKELAAQQGDGRAVMEDMRSPWFLLGPYYALCVVLDTLFKGRPIQRFWCLETVARMPYFSYISMLHLYETLGWWSQGVEVRKVHFAEEWNEMRHLAIMEALGGDQIWLDRFFARHAAIVYYWLLNLIYLWSPRLSYNFSELIEWHAVDTYEEFVIQNKELLKSLPPPIEAMEYYMANDMYMFDEFQTGRKAGSRRPVVRTLYDVFDNIRADEYEHVRTMFACQEHESFIESPNSVLVVDGDELMLDENVVVSGPKKFDHEDNSAGHKM